MNRQSCFRCRRPKINCYCDLIRQVSPPFRLVILLHPREAKKSINTGRMTHFAVAGSQLVEGIDFSDNDRVNRLLEEADASYLMFPSAGALELKKAPIFEGSVPTFFVIDGTWANARKMLSLSHNIAKLPRLCLPKGPPSDYRIRRQPKGHCYSTIETVDILLKSHGSEPEQGAFLDPFEFMVERQLSFLSENSHHQGARRDESSK